jgi:hypothetical protein
LCPARFGERDVGQAMKDDSRADRRDEGKREALECLGGMTG